MDIKKLINLEFQNLTPYQAGKPIEELAREKNLTNIIKLASNENLLGPSPLVFKAIQKELSHLLYYPDPNNYALKQTLEQKYNISSDKIIIGNGSDEIQLLITRAFVNNQDEVIIPKYSFANYKIIANAQRAKIIESDLDNNFYINIEDIIKKITNRTKIIYIANPGNPISTYLYSDKIKYLLENIDKNILVLLDEAYFEYRLEFDSFDTVNLLNKFDNLIITRTFSKAYGLAGLRAGYGFANSQIINLLHQIKLPFNVNRLASIAAICALDDQKYISKILEINHQEKDFLYSQFNKLNLKYIKSYTNFITVKLDNPDKIYNYLLDKGIITRPLKNYSLDNYLRVTIGNHQQNIIFIEKFSKFLQKL
tara:strand:+ start:844 stop:1944 length:1101 start_codon:yes stop_codon:yes gene_type:complete